jgi:hypothetical protein
MELGGSRYFMALAGFSILCAEPGTHGPPGQTEENET